MAEHAQPGGIRLQKFLADRGVASRRACEGLIAAGRVRVNGVVVDRQGVRIDPDADRVEVDGRAIGTSRPGTRVVLLYKPRDYACTRAGGQGRTVFDLLGQDGRAMMTVGRLDRDSEGLLLLTNDGDLANRLMHPRYGHEKVYQVAVEGRLDPDVMASLRQPIEIDGRATLPARVRRLRGARAKDGAVLEFTLGEGRNRQVRRLCERAGLRVRRLVRTSFGTLELQGLKPGAWRALGAGEVRALTGEREPSP